MKRILPAFLVLLSVTPALAQDCVGGRYRDPIFSGVQVSAPIVFGSNTGVNGVTQTLLMDVYEPADDNTISRPVVIVAFGGSFISGSRTDVAILCQEFAKRGYVAIAPDYRVGFFALNEPSTLLAVMRGTHDLKACVRFLRRSVEEGDPWNIDPDRIIVGGVSAGAIAALHAAYLDDETEMPTALVPLSDDIGGVEGLSGNPGYSSEVAACFSLSGAIGDTTWIDQDDVPLVSIHESGDQIVPYYTQEVLVISQPTGVIASGSHDIHVRLENLGIDHCLLTYPTAGHVGYLISDAINSTDHVFNFTANIVCEAEAYCGAEIVGVPEVGSPDNIIYPNPASDMITLGTLSSSAISIVDLHGREVLSRAAGSSDQNFFVGDLPAGVYFLRLAEMPYSVQRLVIAR
ncbi:MAG: T9SS type A sorting domain-containing protein [Bacteroidota bacterium]|nr:T9SS type A sorting domain-containing protein [Bacteroidota bacterium]